MPNHTLRTKFSSIHGSSSPILTYHQYLSMRLGACADIPQSSLLIAAALRAWRTWRHLLLRPARELTLLLRWVHLLLAHSHLLLRRTRTAVSALLFWCLLRRRATVAEVWEAHDGDG
jgi:hypothetical protein